MIPRTIAVRWDLGARTWRQFDCFEDTERVESQYPGGFQSRGPSPIR